MSRTQLTPPIHKSAPPPLHEMEWQAFQRLTADVYSQEPGIATSSEYGLSGQGDRGADVIAHVQGSHEIEVASCKRRQTAKETDLSTWSDEFLDHWGNHWKNQGVRRFVLATTATNVIDRNIQDAIVEEKKRFAKLGISYELWAVEQFVRKMRPNRALAGRHIDEGWVDRICGRPQDSSLEAQSPKALIDAATISQISELQSGLSDQVGKRIESAVKAIRVGRLGEVTEFITELKAEGNWANLVAETRARVVRLEASIALGEDRLDDAEELSREADGIDPQDEPRLAAQIAAQKGELSSAIEILGAPTSTSGRELLAAFHLHAGHLEAAEALLDELADENPESAEFLRIKALAQLKNDQRTAALETISRAEQIEGDWTAIILVGAIVRYAQAFSPFTPSALFLAPNPVDPSLVKSDATSQAMLHDALERFEKWGERDGKKLDADHWILSVLCCIPSKFGEAEELAARLLQNDPADLTAISWSISRGFEVDLKPSLDALRSKYAQGMDKYEVRAFGMLLAAGIAGQHGGEILRLGVKSQIGQAAIEAEEWADRLDGNLLDKEQVPGEAPDFVGLSIRRIQETGDFNDLPAALESAFQASQPGALVLAQFAAENEQWHCLHDFIEQILAFETADAVRLATYIAAKTEDPDRTLSIIQDHNGAFAEALPFDMQRMQADAELRVGRFRDALRGFERISQATGQFEDKLSTARIRAQIGDLKGAAPVVRQGLQLGVIHPTEALRWSHLLQREDGNLSRELYLFAVQNGAGDRFALAAMGQAYRLGLDADAQRFLPLVSKMADGEEALVKRVSLDELSEMISQRRTDQSHNLELYMKGAIPSHLYVGGDCSEFAKIYLSDPLPPGHRLLAKMTRNGARPRDIERGTGWRDLSLHIDITGLFEAYNGGLLDLVLSHPKSVSISPRIPALLLKMENECVHPQPSRIESIRAVVEHVHKGALQQCSTGQEVTDYFVSDGENESGARGRDFSEFAAHLIHLGLVGAEHGLDEREGSSSPDAAPKPGDTLRLDLPSLEKLSSWQVLPAVCAQFSICVERSELTSARAELIEAEAAEQVASKLSDIRQAISLGLENGQVLTLPVASEQRSGEDEQLLGAMADLLSAPGEKDAVAWIDDRHLNGHTSTSHMPIVDTVDVLNSLRDAGLISSSDVNERVSTIRGRGSSFIPFDAQDIVPAVLGAPIVNERIHETTALVAIRQAFALNCRIAPHLKIGDGDVHLKGRPDEFEFGKSLLALLSECLEKIWKDDSNSIRVCYAASDWLWANIGVSRASHSENTKDPDEAHKLIESMQICHCLDKAIEIGELTDARKNYREHYLNWLWQRAVLPRLQTDEHFLKQLVDYFDHFYGSLLSDYRKLSSRRDRIILERLVQIRIQRLPEPIEKELLRRPTFAAFVSVIERVNIGKASFDPYRFWKAARAALRYGKAQTRTDKGKIVRLRRAGSDLVLTGAIRARLSESFFGVLEARSNEREDALQEFASQVEVGRKRTDELARALESAMSPAELVHALERANKDSSAVQYERLSKRLASRENIPVQDFAPRSPKCLEFYLGFSEEASDIGSSFETLNARVGESSAIERLWGIPIALADQAAIKTDTFKSLLGRASTPLARIQVISIGMRSGLVSDFEAEVRVLCETLENGSKLFISALRWVWRWSYSNAEWRSLAQEKRLMLSWAHADKLAALFMQAEIDPMKAAEYFEENAPELQFPDLFASNDRIEPELYHPSRITPEVLLYHGLAEILRDVSAKTLLSDAFWDTLLDKLQTGEVDSNAPHISLVLRTSSGRWSSIPGFLAQDPSGLFEEESTPDATMRRMVDSSLDALEDDPSLPDAWLQLSALSSVGLNEQQWKRARELINTADLWQTPFLYDEARFVVWRGLLSAGISRDRDWVIEMLADLSRRCSEVFGTLELNQKANANFGRAFGAIGELLEIAALLGNTADEFNGPREFCLAANVIVDNWPGSAEQLRQLMSNLVTATAANRCEDFWQFSTYLRTLR